MLARDNAALHALCIIGFCDGSPLFTFSFNIVPRQQDGHYLVTAPPSPPALCRHRTVLSDMALAH